ncbi:MAG: hypothetical protein ACI843_001610 [Psychrobacter glaciei]|jgi:hypothetical protein
MYTRLLLSESFVFKMIILKPRYLFLLPSLLAPLLYSIPLLFSCALYGDEVMPRIILLESPVPGAEYSDPIGDKLTEPKTVRPANNLFILDWSNEVASRYVESLNDNVDSFFMRAFFDPELIEDESSGSNGRIFLSARSGKGQSVNFESGINLKIVLPKTRDRLKLLVETNENDDGNTESSVIGTTDNVTYSTAVRLELTDEKNWKTSLDNGIRWEGKPIYFTRIRARRTDYFDTWRTRYLQSIYWRTDVEWGSIFSLNAIRPIDFSRSFNIGFDADYILKKDMAELESSVSIFHELSYRSALLYQLAAFGDTESLTRVNEAVLSIAYRRKIYKSFVFFEVVPEIGFPRELNYKATPALTLTLEMIFGPDK